MSAPRTTLVLAAALSLAGCVSLTPDAGFDDVKTTVASRTTAAPQWVRSEDDAARAREHVRRTLAAGALSADDAVSVALVNNPGLQATYADVGIAEADVVQASRLRNPGFSYGRTTSGDEIEIERRFFVELIGLLTIPLRTQLERRRFELTRVRVAAETLRVAADTRRAWYGAVAAEEAVRYMGQVKDAAEASAELARRMAAAGNFSKLDHAREQVFYAEAVAQLARVKQLAVSERERLTRLMGLWGEAVRYELPQRLPELPKTPREIEALEETALKERLDVKLAMQDARAIAASLGLTRATGFVSVLELSYIHNNESGRPRETGYEIELRLPIFDWGTARVAKAEYNYMQAVNRAREVAVRARSEVRELYHAYRTAFDVARHYRDEIVPLRKRISEENVLRYNGMLISVFELLADARQQVATVNAYIEALREFWIAEAALRTAMVATSPGDGAVMRARAQPEAAESGGGH